MLNWSEGLPVKREVVEAFLARLKPGDVLLADGSLEHGPHHAVPACRHFGTCGGCQLQQLDEPSLAAFVAERVINAATGQVYVDHDDARDLWVIDPAKKEIIATFAPSGETDALVFKPE